ncbi:MAG: EscU/YscU/HrcU family type III secretion system export apparatus switch protein [Gammaproteobacteria bacterium]|nr:EscU/YscU/HrcU family type III secretion system export apparatus switch protein [Gammaproteobacteria bacterium]MDH5652154.1 EscU/YscU/HrcU family type III secretion system export apparatus switch protein [Gammaproteobacteria bacterium]
MSENNELAHSTIAVALHYDEVNAPRVTAKGRGTTAEQILAIAKAHNIPLEENPALVGVLSELELGTEIPEALYLAVAEVIAFAYMVRGRFPKNWKPE